MLQDDEGHQQTTDQLLNSVKTLHQQYLRKTRQYDAIHEQLTQAAQQVTVWLWLLIDMIW